MMNFQNRIKRIEQEVGIQRQRYVLVILRRNRAALQRERETLLSDEILPGVKVHVWNGQLTDAERQELKTKFSTEAER